MYESNGDFGKTRITDAVLTKEDTDSFFCYTRIFWHCVNDLYMIKRPGGADNFLILITLDGDGVLKLENDTFTLSRGMIAVIPPNIPHSYFTAPDSVWTFYGIHIVNNHAGHIISRLIKENSTCYFHNNTSSVADSLEHIMSVSRSGKYKITHELSKLISDFIHDLFTTNSGASFKSESLFEKAVEYIELNYSTEIDIDELSTRFFTSTSHFIRMFKAVCGITPYQYIENYRMLQARQLLCHTKLSVADIAKKVGYKNTSNFIAYFKRNRGVTPGIYRKNIDKHEQANLISKPFFIKDDTIGNNKYKLR